MTPKTKCVEFFFASFLLKKFGKLHEVERPLPFSFPVPSVSQDNFEEGIAHFRSLPFSRSK